MFSLLLSCLWLIIISLKRLGLGSDYVRSISHSAGRTLLMLLFTKTCCNNYEKGVQSSIRALNARDPAFALLLQDEQQQLVAVS